MRGDARLELEQPILRPPELEALKRLDFRGWRSAVIDATWPAAEGAPGLAAALGRMCEQATAAIESGAALLILSDRAAGAWFAEQLPISSTCCRALLSTDLQVWCGEMQVRRYW